jgi:hypothetical protein
MIKSHVLCQLSYGPKRLQDNTKLNKIHLFLPAKKIVLMTIKDISMMRLESQKITSPGFKTASEVVGWMGAIQAQSESMSKWAIGVRMQNPMIKNIDEAFNKGDILRTHILRPTWHLVRAEDIHWICRPQRS